MSQSGLAADAARRAGSGAGRVARAWRVLPKERRLAALAAFGLFFCLFLPWYQETVIISARSGALHSQSAPLSGWAAFSFVEAVILLVAAGVLTLLFQRAEGREVKLPIGDGWIITSAGGFSCFLIVWRIFDKQSTHINGIGATASGVEWGIFMALAVAGLLTYSGSVIRRLTVSEPARTGDPASPGQGNGYTVSDRRPGERRARPGEPAARRPDGRSRRGGMAFPAPEALADPPTLHLGDVAGEDPTIATGKDSTVATDEDPTVVTGEAPSAVTGDDPTVVRGEDPTRVRDDPDDQLTIPFDEQDR